MTRFTHKWGNFFVTILVGYGEFGQQTTNHALHSDFSLALICRFTFRSACSRNIVKSIGG